MKKVTILMFAIAMIFAGNTYAQVEQGTIRINAGLTDFFKPFGGDSRIGFGAGGEYVFNDNMSGTVSMYFTKKDGAKLNTINVDTRYYLMNESTQVYGSVGYMIAQSGLAVSQKGFVIGAGAVLGITDNIGINAELKYSLLGAVDKFGLLANVGAVFSF